MEKLFTLCTLLLISLICSAEKVQIDGIWYELFTKAKEAEVTSTNDEIGYIGEVTIPETILFNGIEYRVSSIGIGAFSGNENLTSVIIPKSITIISVNTFYGCHKLNYISLPNSIVSIESQAFESCWALTDIEIPNSVTSIGSETFWHCNKLKNIKIGNSIEKIGYSAFGYCKNLTNVYIEDLSSWCNITFESNSSNPFYYAQYLYLKDEEIKNLVIPNTITNIKEYAFYNCSFLTNITIPNSVTRIGNYAFEGCVGLTNITIPNSITDIGYCAFYACEGLKSITIPNSITSIGDATFRFCSNLSSITIPNSIAYMGDEVFEGCKNITDVYCYIERPPTIGHSVFLNSMVEYATLHVPASSIDAYKATEQWSNFGTIVPLTDEELQLQNIVSGSTDPILIQTCDGNIALQGVKTETLVSVYTASGTKIASGIAEQSTPLILNTNIQKGNIAIVKIGTKSMKVIMQ